MDFTGQLSGGLSGQLHFGGEGDTINVNPIITSGTKIATVTVNEGTDEEVNYDLYVPNTLSWNDITDKPQLFSGSYNDLSNKPTYNGEVISGNMYGINISNTPHIVGTWIDGKPIYCQHVAFGNQIALDPNQWYTYPDYDASHVQNLINAICIVRPGGDAQYPSKDVKSCDVGIENGICQNMETGEIYQITEKNEKDEVVEITE